MIKIFIKEDQNYSKPIGYILSVFSKNKSISITFVKNALDASLIFDHIHPASLPINIAFFESLIDKEIYNHETYFENEPYILFPDTGKRDYLATAFYLINSFQEYNAEQNPDALDKYGRFRFSASVQYKFKCIEKNLVQECFDQFYLEQTTLSNFDSHSIHKSKVFLSHDIDSIYGSFFEDGMWALQKGRFDIILKLIMNEVLLRPNWKNMDQIVKLHSVNDLKSTFFWIATNKISTNGIKNADYSIQKIKKLTETSKSNGLHKSAYSTSFEDELDVLPFKTKLNRYHYLKFRLPDAWNELEEAKLNFDSSLGFAEHYGFRNSYGLPFSPYHIGEQRKYSFLEVPLNMMDRTLQSYMNIPLEKTATTIIDFIEKNKTNCILSILWHNNFFAEYKYGGYLEEYKKVLQYLHEEKIHSITPEEIINEYAND